MSQSKSKTLSVSMSLRSADAGETSMEECLKSETEGAAPFLSGKESSGSDVEDDSELVALQEEQRRCSKKLVKRQVKAKIAREKELLRQQILQLKSELSIPLLIAAPVSADPIQNGDACSRKNSSVLPVLNVATNQNITLDTSGSGAVAQCSHPNLNDQVSAVNDHENDRNNAYSSIIGHSKMAPLSKNENITVSSSNLTGFSNQPLPPVNLLTPEPSRPANTMNFSRNTAGCKDTDIILLPSDVFLTNSLQECRINAVHTLPGFDRRHAVGPDGRVYNSSADDREVSRAPVHMGVHGVKPVAGSSKSFNQDVRPKVHRVDSDYSARSDSRVTSC